MVTPKIALRIWKCQICGKLFEGRKKKYCSIECRNKVPRKPTARKWFYRICVQCGKSFITQQDRTQCCSKECANQKRYLTTHPDTLPKPIYHCQECGKVIPIKPRRGSKPGPHRLYKYCSKVCSGISIARKHGFKTGLYTNFKRTKVSFILCPICGKLFASHKGRKARCSRECDLEYGRERERKYFVSVRKTNPFLKKTCNHCGKQYITNFRANQRGYCSYRCAKKHAKRQRRAKKRNQFVAHVSLNDIYLRDGGRCQLCGRKVNRKLKPGSMMSGTLDHIVPLAKGGLHKDDNVQLAHFICNSKKSDKVIGQLRLGL